MRPDSRLRIILSKIRHPRLAWQRMNPHSNLKFVFSIFVHPSQAWRRIRELKQMASEPSLDNKVPSDAPPDVELIPVSSDASLQEELVAVYGNNPSPYVQGPKSIGQLQEKLDRGIRYFLVRNSEGETVGARAFDPSKKMLRNSVSDYRHRGKGYHLAGGRELRKLLASEGHTEFRAIVLRSNTRVQRTMQAAGWVMKPDPDNADLILATLRMDSESSERS
jgi:hypothetical protein